MIDASHLKLLAIFHFVFAGLTLLGLGFLFLHWWFMHAIMENPEMWKNQQGGPPPKEFIALFKWVYLFFGTGIVLTGVANTISGWSLMARRNRTFSLVVAGLNCMAFPFGTALGVFTFIVLLRDSVRELYEAQKRPIMP